MCGFRFFGSSSPEERDDAFGVCGKLRSWHFSTGSTRPSRALCCRCCIRSAPSGCGSSSCSTTCFRWFAGLGMDEAVWAPTTFTKNRDRLLEGDTARPFFEDVVAPARGRRLLFAEHLTVDGYLAGGVGRSEEFQAERPDRGPPPVPARQVACGTARTRPARQGVGFGGSEANRGTETHGRNFHQLSTR